MDLNQSEKREYLIKKLLSEKRNYQEMMILH